MQGAFITAIVFGGIVLSLTVIGATILMGIRLIKDGVSKSHRQQETEDTKTIQTLYRELSRFEERVDALETILLDRKKGADDETIKEN
jgi:phage shock protein B